VFGNLLFPRYGTYAALKNVSFDVKEGEILGLLGPNGAGKTTVIKILMGLLRPTSGSALIMGKPAEKQQSRIGLFFGHTTMTYHRITGYDNLKYYGALYGVKDMDSKIDALSRQLRLKKWLDEFVEHYSKGMKIKLSLARALIHDPDVLLLDEPTLGLDARTSEYITSKLPKLQKTILYTTHYIEEAKKLSDRVVVLKNGKVAKVFSKPAKADIKGEMMK
jgi:ABC-type multidrug transport system ATPase subunit